ncbi:hypothetical protein H6G89_10605 [Oscillatoria sp. FACHB-1407]|uniref:hypothetical protein n=1 Tax=Oscillatoria sp. FACHB-1407 TaxID=2692847 RepID=UPI00168A0464|nr:hypothetical protein [Oscillatoria sp. FACHB-1407]MBD2461499.1 hypothetical protein [Oscillatoria sp. FACHB-1407]
MQHNPFASISVLLTHYCFDLEEQTTEEVVKNWLGEYPAKWVLSAIVEALYQGRYKVTSVEKILFHWRLRGKPNSHFDREFADLVCRVLLRRARLKAQKMRARQMPLRAAA